MFTFFGPLAVTDSSEPAGVPGTAETADPLIWDPETSSKSGGVGAGALGKAGDASGKSDDSGKGPLDFSGTVGCGGTAASAGPLSFSDSVSSSSSSLLDDEGANSSSSAAESPSLSCGWPSKDEYYVRRACWGYSG